MPLRLDPALKRKRTAIAPTLAVLMTITVAIALAMLYYAWISGWLTRTSGVIKIDSVDWGLEVYGVVQYGFEFNACPSCHNSTYGGSGVIDMTGQSYCNDAGCHDDGSIAERYIVVYNFTDSTGKTYDDYSSFNSGYYWQPNHALTGTFERCTKCHDVHRPNLYSTAKGETLDECWACHNWTGSNPSAHTEVFPHDLTGCSNCHGLRHGGTLNTIVVYVRNKGTGMINISRLVINGQNYYYTVLEGDLSDELDPDETVALCPIKTPTTEEPYYFAYTSGTRYRIEVHTTTGTLDIWEETAP